VVEAAPESRLPQLPVAERHLTDLVRSGPAISRRDAVRVRQLAGLQKEVVVFARLTRSKASHSS